MRFQRASVDRSAALAENGLELGEGVLDGIEIGRVFGQVEEARADGLDGLADRVAFVGAEIVEHDDVAGLECRGQDLLDIGEEPRPLIGPSSTMGAVIRSCRRAATNVVVFQRASGILPMRRCPRRQRP